MNLDNYAREKVKAAYAACDHIRAGICRPCARELVRKACTDTLRGAVAALRSVEDYPHADQTGLILKPRAISAVKESTPEAEEESKQ